MVAIRTRRMEAGIKAVSAAEGRLREALDEQRRMEGELESWRRLMAAETERRWAALLGTLTTTEGLEDFRAGLAELGLREAALMGEVEMAKKEVSVKRSEAEAAREELAARSRAKEKLEFHREAWLAAEAAELDRLESLELEEFNRPVPEPAD
jgi:DNA repair exonuclease SbcCD ATPase subunit